MTFDAILQNGKIVDGKGNPWKLGDIAVKDGRVARMGRKICAEAHELIDLTGFYICPGFVDVHTHSDYVFFVDSKAQSKVRQGVTTEVTGNCGMSGAPFEGPVKERDPYAAYGFTPFWDSVPTFLQALAKQPKPVNIAPLIGHGTLRCAVMGMADRAPSTNESDRLGRMLSEGLQAGAFGLSTGLYFAPGAYAQKEELVALGKIAADHGTLFASHIRDEGSRSVGFIPAVREIIQIGQDAGVPIQISHLKSFGPDVWHTAEEVLGLMDDARAQGVDVTCDQYPYEATGGLIAADTLPVAFQSGKSPQQVSDDLKKTDTRTALRKTVAVNIDKRGGAQVLTIANYPFNPELEGRTLQDICGARKQDPAEVVMDMLSDSCVATWNCQSLDAADVDAYLRYPWTMVGSDGSSLSTEGPLSAGNPHPRNFGAFPRVLSYYVRKREVLRMEEAIRKMTSLPAQRFSLHERGCLEEGYWADIVVFDAQAIQDAGFKNPKQYPEGIPHVMVNGEWVIKDHRFTGNLPGRLARRK